jgi:redox-regulated HSP33 family molecular chaperone
MPNGPTDRHEQYDSTQDLLKRIKAQSSYQQKQDRILQDIAHEKRLRVLEAEAIAVVDRKLSEVEREYLETIKAQEIMDQIDENRKRDA